MALRVLPVSSAWKRRGVIGFFQTRRSSTAGDTMYVGNSKYGKAGGCETHMNISRAEKANELCYPPETAMCNVRQIKPFLVVGTQVPMNMSVLVT